MTVYEEIFEVIKQRKAAFENGTAQENSYTCYLFDKGVDKICKKVGEEAAETIIAAKNGDRQDQKIRTAGADQQIIHLRRSINGTHKRRNQGKSH